MQTYATLTFAQSIDILATASYIPAQDSPIAFSHRNYQLHLRRFAN
jgi:hypothetical protein